MDLSWLLFHKITHKKIHQIRVIKLAAALALPLALGLLLTTVPVETYAQNSSGLSATKTPLNTSNKTTIAVAPGNPATVVTTGNKTTISATPKPSTGSSSLGNFNRTGFSNIYVLTSSNGKTFPIKYTIFGGKIVGMLADKDRTTVVLVVSPSASGGNFTLELPRIIIDSKGASNADTKYQVKIDGKGVDYKEVANNVNARILSINFSKDNRFIEIIGTQMAS
jgi:hypothetical protein